ncbi:hypothetical protein ACVCAH_13535 [Micromonospora sp. LZ34]
MRTARAVSAGQWAWLLLLFSTLFGLAAMHTLGHGTHAGHGSSVAGHGSSVADHHGGAVVDGVSAVAAHLATAAAAVVVPALGSGGCPDGCPTERVLPSGGSGGGELPGWGVCLAVLGALGVSVLVAVLLLGSARVPGFGIRPVRRSAAASRAPPPRPVGLRLATVAVLRS